MTFTLSDLSSVDDDQMPSVFKQNLPGIYAYTMSDITEVLAKFSKDNLGRLHKDLISMVVDAFPGLQNRKPIKRQAVNTLIGDIAVLGCSIVNNSMHKDIERVFHPPSATDDSSLCFMLVIGSFVLDLASRNV